MFSTKSVYSPIKKHEEVWVLQLLMFTLHICSKVVIFWSLLILFVESCVFINNSFNQDSFSIFNENFKFVSTSHSYNTRSASNSLLCVPSYNSVRSARKSIINLTTLTCISAVLLHNPIIQFTKHQISTYIYSTVSTAPSFMGTLAGISHTLKILKSKSLTSSPGKRFQTAAPPVVHSNH